MTDLTIRYTDVGDLIPYINNARTHSDEQVSQIAASISEFGFNNPVLIDAAGGIIAGHGRVLAARKLGMERLPTVAIADLTATQRKAFMIADNRLAMNAGWDAELLRMELADLAELGADLKLLGFNESELAEAMGGAAKALADEDNVPDPPAHSIATIGDVWHLGRHRLLCGDASTSVDAFLSGVEPDLLYFDPPYEVEDAWSWTYPTEKALVFTDYKHIREAMGVVLAYPVQYQFVWDTVISWYTANRPLCRHRSAFYCAQEHGWDSDAATYIDGKHRAERVIDGGAFPGSYNYKPLSAGRVRLQTLYTQSKTLDEAGNGKPVAWVRALLAGARAHEVYEPFAGTGSTIIAAPEAVRVHAIEIEPIKVDAIVARWEAVTGGAAVRA